VHLPLAWGKSLTHPHEPRRLRLRAIRVALWSQTGRLLHEIFHGPDERCRLVSMRRMSAICHGQHLSLGPLPANPLDLRHRAVGILFTLNGE